MDLPYLDLKYPSTTYGVDDAIMSPGRRSRRAQWRKAPPLRLFTRYGRRTPVSVTLTPRISSELWIEVSDFRGRFFIRHDSSVWDLISKLQEGGYYVKAEASTTDRRRRGTAAGS